MILYMYVAPGQEQTTTWGQNCDDNRNSLLLCPFVASLNKISLKSDFLPFLCCFFFPHKYIAQGKGRQPIGDTNFMTTYVASFKMISWKPDFKHIFNDFIHVYSPGARTENPLGTNFGCQ